MPEINVDSTILRFPAGWKADKYDNWSFYRNQFSKMRDNIKAVDLLAFDEDNKVLWLIEVKDYRIHAREKNKDICDEIWEKVYSTLAALLPASILANEHNEADFARRALTAAKLRVAFYCRLPRSQSKLFPTSFDMANLQTKFRHSFKAIDPHALAFCDLKIPAAVQWSVQ